MSIEMAIQTLEDYIKPDSLIDCGNLYFAGTTFQRRCAELESENQQLREENNQKLDRWLDRGNDLERELRRCRSLLERLVTSEFIKGADFIRYSEAYAEAIEFLRSPVSSQASERKDT